MKEGMGQKGVKNGQLNSPGPLIRHNKKSPRKIPAGLKGTPKPKKNGAFN